MSKAADFNNKARQFAGATSEKEKGSLRKRDREASFSQAMRVTG